MGWLADTFSTTGRLGRLSYLLGTLAGLVFAVVPVVVLGLVALILEALPGGAILRTIVLSMAVFSLIAGIVYVCALMDVKRLRDIGLSGWHCVWVLAVCVASTAAFGNGNVVLANALGLVQLVIGLWLQFMPGNAGANRFGQAPA